jgi:streptogramin lyase
LDTTGEDTDFLFGVYSASQDLNDSQDEAILNFVLLTDNDGRHLIGTRTVAVDSKNDVWVGVYGECEAYQGTSENRWHFQISSQTGSILHKFNPGKKGGYGGLIDKNGWLWSSQVDASAGLLVFNPAAEDWNTPSLEGIVPIPEGVEVGLYGIGIDPVTGFIWHNSNGADGQIHRIKVENGTISSDPPFQHGQGQGLVLDQKGNVWIADSHSAVHHLRTSGTYIGEVALACGDGASGVAVDSNGKVWVTLRGTDQLMRIDPNRGRKMLDGLVSSDPLAMPVGEVDLVVNLPAGSYPYNYSDMTGYV